MPADAPREPETRTLSLDLPIPAELAELADRVAAAKGVSPDKLLSFMVAYWSGRMLGKVFQELQDDEQSRN